MVCDSYLAEEKTAVWGSEVACLGSPCMRGQSPCLKSSMEALGPVLSVLSLCVLLAPPGILAK